MDANNFRDFSGIALRWTVAKLDYGPFHELRTHEYPYDDFVQAVRVRAVHVEMAIAAVGGDLVAVKFARVFTLNCIFEPVLQGEQRAQITRAMAEVNNDSLFHFVCLCVGCKRTKRNEDRM